MIDRHVHRRELERLLKQNPIVALLGTPQAGKTTLAKGLVGSERESTHFFDLESPADTARLADAFLALEPLRGLVVLDEIQRRPDIFGVLRRLVDRPRFPARFLVLSGASPDFLRQSSESLAGRMAYYELPGIALTEVTPREADRLWLRGGFPLSYTARSYGKSYEWRGEFVRRFLERDLPQLGIAIPAATLERFLSMLAHYHAQVWNSSELARALGVSHHTAKRYLDVLEATLILRSLKPWNANIRKRQVKSPKVYIRDSGILHRLLGVASREALDRHPKVGASWEGFWLENVIQALALEDRQCYFWGTHVGHEIDLIVEKDATLRGFEIKRTSAPSLTPSIKVALEDLGVSRIDVIHAGPESFPLAEQVQAVSAARLLNELYTRDRREPVQAGLFEPELTGLREGLA